MQSRSFSNTNIALVRLFDWTETQMMNQLNSSLKHPKLGQSETQTAPKWECEMMDGWMDG